MSVPLILVPARPAPAGRASRHAASFVVQPSIDALRRAGAEVWVLPPAPYTDAEARALIGRGVAGLCLQGGADVHPRHYETGDGRDGDSAPDDDVDDVDDVQDRSELALTRAAIDLGLPVLALCRGAQLLNVACGGTLHVAIDVDGVAHHPDEPPGTIGAVHGVEVRSGTRLRTIIGAARAAVSSVHHQAIDRLGTGLVVAATADDGLVEAVELDRGWVIGVQWHPEDTASADPVQQRLFDAFVSACR